MEIRVIESTGMDIIRGFFALLDSVVYWLIAWCYDFIQDIAAIRLSDGIISEVANRVYAILGLFMLFKVSFSFVNYIINPDSISDKEKGIQKIIMNIVVMFIMLVMSPWAFDQLYGLQQALLDDNTIGNLVFGTNEGNTIQFKMHEDCEDSATINLSKHKGKFLALTLFKPFYQLVRDPGDFNGFGDGLSIYCTTETNPTVSYYLDNEVYNRAKGWFAGTYNVSYLFGISTAIGVVALLILISMCMDIALRAVKLMFLQLIAPVPIISYIDPKSGKNGMFKKWISEIGSTWASLFVRLFAVNFAVFMIAQLLVDDDVEKIINNDGFLINIVLIIGALMFAKQLPEIISNITGIKMKGGFSINPIKKFQDQALGGKQIVGGARRLAGATAGMIGAGVSHGFAVANKKNKLQGNVNDANDVLSQKQNDLNNEKARLNEIRQQRANNRSEYAQKKSDLMNLQLRKNDLTKRLANTDPNDAKAMYEAKSALERVDNQIASKQNEINAVLRDTDKLGKDYKSQEASVNSAQGNLDKAKEELDEAINKRDSYKPSAGGYASEMAYGALYGSRHAANNPGHYIHNTAEAIKDASEMRNYREKYSMQDDIMNRLHEIGGIKNDSGTTSVIKKELKVQNDNLNEINRSIEMLNRSISQMSSDLGAEFSKAIKYGANNRMEIDPTYQAPSAKVSDQIRNFEKLLDAYYGRVDAKIDIERKIKDLKDTVEKAKPNSGK